MFTVATKSDSCRKGRNGPVSLGSGSVSCFCRPLAGAVLTPAKPSLFLPSAALVPAVAFMLAFKIDGTASKWTGYTLLAARHSEAVEFYLYFFIFAYLVIFERRLREIEAETL